MSKNLFERVVSKMVEAEDSVIATIILDWKDISANAIKEFASAFEQLGYHFGDAEQEYHGEAVSDTFYLYVARRPLSKKGLLKVLRGG